MSAVRTNRERISRPAGWLRSTPTLRLLRLSCSTKKLTPRAPGTSPEVMRPRIGSPRTGCSILMMSAPQSPRTVAAEGTNPQSATSIRRIPRRMSSIRAGHSLRLRDDAQVGLQGLPPAGELLLGVLVGERRDDDHVATVLPVHRRRDAVLVGELERV